MPGATLYYESGETGPVLLMIPGGPALLRRLAERHNRIIHWPQGNPGGHFVAMEVPDRLAADIRTFFAKLR